MKKEVEYTEAPLEIDQSLDRAVEVPNFAPTLESVKEFVKLQEEKPVRIYGIKPSQVLSR